MESREENRPEDTHTPDRVRDHTSDEVNASLDRDTQARIHGVAARGRDEIERRIEELDREWDVERLLELNASALAGVGTSLALATGSKKWLILPGVVFSFFLQHAVQGWCPPIPIFRRLGVRTRQEIDREKYALKALRGDYENLSDSAQAGQSSRAEAALRAVDA